MSRFIRFILPAVAVAALFAVVVSPAGAPATGAIADQWWPTYGGSFENTRHVDLGQIRPANVASLKLAWSFNTGIVGQLETSPVAVDGALYVTTGPDNGVFALDAATGALKWHYVPKVGRAAYIFAVNRGVAEAGGRVFFATLDNQLIALDEHSGTPVWTTKIGASRDGLSETAAPLAWGGLVFIGSSGGEMGVRGSYSAYSQRDGKLVWRWWSVSPGWEGAFHPTIRGLSLHRNIPAEREALARYPDAWKHGGGAIWMTPALSPAESTIYLSTGNPSPTFNADLRPGDNLYTDCVVALDARSGKMKWYYQETPHDIWDYDASSPPMLFDTLDGSGRRVPAVAESAKTGWMYTLNRTNGRLIRVSPFIPQPGVYHALSAKGEPVEPGDSGGGLSPMAYDPTLHAAFVAGNVAPEIGQSYRPPPWHPGETEWRGGDMQESTATQSSLLSRVDTDSGQVRWRTPVPNEIFGGPLSIDGLVFLGEERTGMFKAYDADDGKVLWSVSPGDELGPHYGVHDFIKHLIAQVNLMRHPDDVPDADIHSPAIAYRAGGREYVVIPSFIYQNKTHIGGNTIFAFALP